MAPAQCPQCGEELAAPAASCPTCGAATAGRARRVGVTTLLLLAALAASIVGAFLVVTSSNIRENRSAVGYVLFLAGFATYVVVRGSMLWRRWRHPD